MRWTVLTEEEEKEIVERYKAGESICSLQNVYHISSLKIKELLKRFGVHVRDRGEAARVRIARNPPEPDYLPTLKEIEEAKIKIRLANNKRLKRETQNSLYLQPYVSGIKVCKLFRQGRKSEAY